MSSPAGIVSAVLEVGDAFEANELFQRNGWTDGLPVVPPTEARVLRMLTGTTRAPDEIVAIVPPDLVPCPVETVAVNPVLAGCLPRHLPAVLAPVAAPCPAPCHGRGPPLPPSLPPPRWWPRRVMAGGGPLAAAGLVVVVYRGVAIADVLTG